MHKTKEIQTWLETLNQKKSPQWDSLPDLELYMDQVLTYLDKQLSVYQKNDEDKVITSSMINNYVKANIIESPVSKKYNKNQLAHLYAISILKRVLPMPDVKKVLNTLGADAEMQYLAFRNAFDQTLDKNVHSALDFVASDPSEEALHPFILSLILDAHAKLMIANKLLSSFQEEHKEEPKKKKETP